MHVLARQLAQVARGAQGLAHLVRHVHELADQVRRRLVGRAPVAPAEVDGEQGQRRELGGEALGGGHADLGAGVGVERPDRQARAMAESTTLQMASVRAPRALASLTAARVSRVSPLWEMATTRSLRAHHRLAVAELARQIDLARDARDVLDEELADQAGVVRGPAGQDHHAVRRSRRAIGPSRVTSLAVEQQAGCARYRSPPAAARGSP